MRASTPGCVAPETEKNWAGLRIEEGIGAGMRVVIPNGNAMTPYFQTDHTLMWHVYTAV